MGPGRSRSCRAQRRRRFTPATVAASTSLSTEQRATAKLCAATQPSFPPLLALAAPSPVPMRGRGSRLSRRADAKSRCLRFLHVACRICDHCFIVVSTHFHSNMRMTCQHTAGVLSKHQKIFMVAELGKAQASRHVSGFLVGCTAAYVQGAQAWKLFSVFGVLR